MIKKNREYFEIVKKFLDPTDQRTAKLCLTPYIFDRQFWNKMKAVTQAYANLLEFVFHEYPTNKKIQEVLEYPGDLENFIHSLNIYEKNLAAARIDIFVTKDGLRMVESNC